MTSEESDREQQITVTFSQLVPSSEEEAASALMDPVLLHVTPQLGIAGPRAIHF